MSQSWRPQPVPVKPGDRVRLKLPYSEVCMHMRVAGRVMDVQLTDGADPMAQLLKPSGEPLSAPITIHEAGIYGWTQEGFYCYPADLADELGEQLASLLDDDEAETFE